MSQDRQDKHTLYMRRCLTLAARGLGLTAPNPMVGAVIESAGEIIGEGYHRRCGGLHAEAAALEAVRDKEKLSTASLYVNLEPCGHYGKTPPCVKRIVQAGVPKVYAGCLDPNPDVSGKGVEQLRKAGIEVNLGILESECMDLNKRFFVYHQNKRPYVILKWAQTEDGFIAREDYTSKWISCGQSRSLVHRWRFEEDAVLVGTKTALVDNPRLTVRMCEGQNPLRLLIDRRLEIPETHHLLSDGEKTIVFNESLDKESGCVRFVKIDFNQNVITQIMSKLYEMAVVSVIIEGGAETISSFVAENVWDEARVFISPSRFKRGIAAPVLPLVHHLEERTGRDRLFLYRNTYSAHSSAD